MYIASDVQCTCCSCQAFHHHTNGQQKQSISNTALSTGRIKQRITRAKICSNIQNTVYMKSWGAEMGASRFVPLLEHDGILYKQER
jgi:hypothetical protein